MLINQLQQPSLGEIRANLITEQFKKIPLSPSCINIFVTGKSGSGKTTLGNRLIGEDYFLTTGRQNTTQVVNLIDFSGAIRFFDLPGVDGAGRQKGKRLENYNRASLNLNQHPNYPNITDITITTYVQNSNPKEHKYKINEFKKLPFNSDIVFYLIDPKKGGLSRSEQEYIIDLIESGQNVVYVLNVFLNKHNKPKATQQNFEDIEKCLKEIHEEFLPNKEPVIIKINCQTGQGIDNLLQQAYISLGNNSRSLLIKDVLVAQHQKAPQQYIDLIKQELVKVFVDVAYYKPNSIEDVEDKLKDTSKLLWDYLISLSLHKINLSESRSKEDKLDFERINNSYLSFQKIIRSLFSVVINGCKTDYFKPVTVPLLFFNILFREKQFLKTETQLENDYDNPLYAPEVVELRTPTGIKHSIVDKPIEGLYEQKMVARTIPYRRIIFNDFDAWTNPIALKRYLYSSYNYLGIDGICFVQCLCLAIVTSNFQNKYQFRKNIYTYYSSLKRLSNIDSTFIDLSEKKEVEEIITKNINLILNHNFDLPAMSAFVEVEGSIKSKKPLSQLFKHLYKDSIIRLHFELNKFKKLSVQLILAIREIFDEFPRQYLELVFYYTRTAILIIPAILFGLFKSIFKQ